MNNQEECSLSELELFKRSVVQSDILNGKFEKIYPITKLEHFLDLRKSYLNSDGSNLAANAKVGLVNYPIASLFQ